MPDVFITGIDVLVGIVILVSAIYAAYRGLMRETLSIFAWAIAAYSSLLLYPMSQPLLADSIEPAWLAGAAAILGVFLIIFIPLSFAAHRFSQKVDKTAIGPVDRTLGFLFGVGRGLVIVALAYIVFSSFVPISHHPGWIKRARLLPLIQSTSEVLLTLVPENNSLRHHSFASDIAEPKPRAATAQKSGKQQGYGADDRRALDRLIEATGGK